MAEVLITIGIIGVVSALVMPGIVRHYHKIAVESALKQSYSQINQLLERSESDFGEAINWDWENYASMETASASHLFFNKYFAPYMLVNGEKGANGYGSYYYKINSWYRDKNGIEPLYYMGFHTPNWKQLPNGSVIMFNYMYNPSRPDDYPNWAEVAVILPTAVKKDKLILGKDVFRFSLRREQNSIKLSYKSYLNWQCSSVWADMRNVFIETCRGDLERESGIGPEMYCGALIYCNNWNIPDDYPIKF